jgi:CHASE3 domain sensor protein
MLKLSFRNQVLAGFAVSIVLVLICWRIVFQKHQAVGRRHRLGRPYTKVIKTTNNLLQLLIDGETGMRGYGATANKKFLDPYNVAFRVSTKR